MDKAVGEREFAPLPEARRRRTARARLLPRQRRRYDAYLGAPSLSPLLVLSLISSNFSLPIDPTFSYPVVLALSAPQAPRAVGNTADHRQKALQCGQEFGAEGQSDQQDP